MSSLAEVVDAENSCQSYKWGNVVIGALAVLGVTMASSMMSAAIYDIRRAFPGYSSEMYIMSESFPEER